MLASLPIDKISLRSDARVVAPESIAALEASIAEVGLINPIRVRAAGDGWEVIAGAHRLTACRSLGLVEIDAIVAEDDDLRAELAMIDENLCRAELSPSEKAQQTARRKAIYLQLHPETGHGKASPSKVDNLSSFAEATAAVTGADARTVRRDAERGEKIYDAAFAQIKGTALDTGVFLDKLKKLTPSEQMVVVKRELAWLKEQNRKGGIARRVVKLADAPLDDEEAQEKQVAALMAAWNKASAEARQEFLSRIDTPVMDRSAA